MTDTPDFFLLFRVSVNRDLRRLKNRELVFRPKSAARGDRRTPINSKRELLKCASLHTNNNTSFKKHRKRALIACFRVFTTPFFHRLSVVCAIETNQSIVMLLSHLIKLIDYCPFLSCSVARAKRAFIQIVVKVIHSHCGKSRIFVQKFDFDANLPKVTKV